VAGCAIRLSLIQLVFRPECAPPHGDSFTFVAPTTHPSPAGIVRCLFSSSTVIFASCNLEPSPRGFLVVEIGYSIRFCGAPNTLSLSYPFWLDLFDPSLLRNCVNKAEFLNTDANSKDSMQHLISPASLLSPPAPAGYGHVNLQTDPLPFTTIFFCPAPPLPWAKEIPKTTVAASPRLVPPFLRSHFQNHLLSRTPYNFPS